MALRVSIEVGATRFCTVSTETTCAAAAKAALTFSSSPAAQSKHSLPGALSQICGPPGAEASVPRASSGS
jgi:hypothetical protein